MRIDFKRSRSSTFVLDAKHLGPGTESTTVQETVSEATKLKHLDAFQLKVKDILT